MLENPPEDKDFKLWQLLLNTVNMVSKARTKELQKHTISTNTAAVLDCIISSPTNPTPSQIARWLIREPQSTSGILNRIEKRGLITKTVDSARKNVIRVALTEEGKELYNKIIKKRKTIHSIVSVLSEEERQQMETCLRKLQTKVTPILKK
jgi:MarR family transcriptional regulator, organic hydroperoxide resistance regulator